MVVPSFTRTFEDKETVLIGGTPLSALAKSGSSLASLMSSLTPVSSIKGITSRESAASLNEVDVAPCPAVC